MRHWHYSPSRFPWEFPLISDATFSPVNLVRSCGSVSYAIDTEAVSLTKSI